MSELKLEVGDHFITRNSIDGVLINIKIVSIDIENGVVVFNKWSSNYNNLPRLHITNLQSHLDACEYVFHPDTLKRKLIRKLISE